MLNTSVVQVAIPLAMVDFAFNSLRDYSKQIKPDGMKVNVFKD